MKIALALTLLFSASASFASTVAPGKYASNHEIALMYADTAATCKDNGGKFDGDVCVIEGDDELIIKARKGSNKMIVSVSTVGTNLHTCDFSGVGIQQADGSILAKTKVDVYGEDDKVKKAVCALQITNEKAGVGIGIVNNSNEACSQLCGANAWLEGGGYVK